MVETSTNQQPVPVLFRSEQFVREFGTIRLEEWPEGLVLSVGGEVRWCSWRDPGLWCVRRLIDHQNTTPAAINQPVMVTAPPPYSITAPQLFVGDIGAIIHIDPTSNMVAVSFPRLPSGLLIWLEPKNYKILPAIPAP